MQTSDGPHAFISYVREDSDLVDELEGVLLAAGVPVWRDLRNIFPGDVWKARIRDAIRGDALAFIPVFSAQSESRIKSTMRAEIRIAIDEYQTMSPDRSWIFPVRLDDVAVPQFEISGGQTLRDLNWTDFFGGRKTVEATRLIASVQRVLGAADHLVAPPAVVASSATETSRGGLLSAAIREGVADPTRAAVAGDLLIEEARRVVDALRDPHRFSMNAPDGSMTKALRQRTEELAALIGPLVEAAMELGARGKPEDAPMASQLVSSLAREGYSPAPGAQVASLARLQRFPALCVLVAGALGATARRNGPMLAAFVAEPVMQVDQGVLPVAALLSPWAPFGSSWELAQYINTTQRGGDVTQDQLAAYDSGRVERTSAASASEIVGRVLAGPGAKFAVGPPEFDELYERTEILVAAITYDWVLREGIESTAAVENWISGRTRTADQHTVTPMPERMLAEVESAIDDWWPLHDTGLFGRNAIAAMSCMAEYVELVTDARARARSS